MDIEQSQDAPASEAPVPDVATQGESALSIALELVKQLITLAAGVLALTAAFTSGLGSQPWYVLLVLGLAWLALAMSVFFGIQTLSAMVKSRLMNDDKWSTGYGKKAAWLCKYAFLVGIALFAAFAMLALTSHVTKDSSPSEPGSGTERPAPTQQFVESRAQ